jgi:uncharacterized protein HemX
MDPKQNTNQPQVAPPAPPPVVPVQPQPTPVPVTTVSPPAADGKSKSSRGIFIALFIVFLLIAGGMLYFIFVMPGNKNQEVTQIQTQPTTDPTPTQTPQLEEEQLEEVVVASPEADLTDLEKELNSL